MKQIDARTVEFTHYAEVAVKERFDELLADGLGIPQAALAALSDDRICPRHRRSQWFRRNFTEYLSEGTVIVTHGGTVILTGKGRDLVQSAEGAR